MKLSLLNRHIKIHTTSQEKKGESKDFEVPKDMIYELRRQ
jgi:hypothetical protein